VAAIGNALTKSHSSQTLSSNQPIISSFIHAHSFIHYMNLYSASSRLLLRSAPGSRLLTMHTIRN